MASNKIGYALRMYAPRSVDPAEATILTPAAGAAHSDDFKVSSIERTGYKTYLQDTIPGRRGRIDLLNRKLDVGHYTATLIDKRLTAGDNLTRWWSAFFGDVKGKPPGRLKVEIDETLDGGATWSAFAVTEIVGTKLVGKNQVQLALNERVELLKMRVFVSQPHVAVTYAAQPTLLPVGFRNSDYGKFKRTRPLTGTTGTATIAGTDYTPAGERGVKLDVASRFHEANVLTQQIRQVLPPWLLTGNVIDGVNVFGSWPDFRGPLRCHLKRLDTNAEGEFKVGSVTGFQETRDGRTHWRAYGVALRELDSASDVGYMAAPAAGVSVEVALYVDGEISEAHPLLLNDVDPATYLQDLCDGKFGQLYRPPLDLPPGKSYGDAIRTMPTNGLASLVGKRPAMRLAVTKPSTAIQEIERVCRENNWAPYIDRQGRLNVADLALPSSIGGIATLTDTDVVEEEDVDWSHDPTSAIYLALVNYYSERLLKPTDLWQQDAEFPAIDGGGLEETKHIIAPLYIGSIDYGEQVFRLDGKGYRTQDGEQVQAQPRSTYLGNALAELANSYSRPFAYGLTTIPLTCRRTATVTALTQGSLVIADVDVLPDPGTHKRGGALLCRVLEVSEDGPEIQLRLVFLASATGASAPTLAAPAQETGNTWSGVTTAVTVNASAHPVQVRYAVTATSVGSVPADDSALWVIAGLQKATGTFIIRNLPPGQRIWVQGRSFPIFGVTLELPSAWTNAGGTGRVDTAALATPSALAATKTDKTAQLTWTNGATDVPTEILLATPTSDPRVRVGIAPMGSTQWDLDHLDPSTTYRAEVRHLFGEHPGPGDTEDFTTNAGGSAAAAMISHTIYGAT